MPGNFVMVKCPALSPQSHPISDVNMRGAVLAGPNGMLSKTD
jgi:hypothetical protein